MGLAADGRGAFHPFWADARTGTFHAWTATIRVLDEANTGGGAPAGADPATTATWPSADVTAGVEFAADPTRYDATTRTLEIPVRLRNTSGRRLAPPLELTIDAFGSGPGDVGRERAPTILNAANGLEGAGAVFDFSDAIGGAGLLEPGAHTAAVVLRLRLEDPLDVPDLHVSVRAAVEPEDTR
jgi:hypothetical protein